ncbi:MAG: MipA/OmpV family protein [Candidatus Pacebacteria bacterium]|nr:MipA/OmpV family protein [Candidatus Paceibacterota bacterium]
MTALIKRTALAAMVLVSAAVVAEERPVTIELGVDAVSNYVWRGQLLTDDPVLQPSVTVGYKGFSLNAWGSIDMTDVNEVGDEDYRLQEVDYTLSYAFSSVEGLDLEGGVIHYDFPGTGFDATRELYGSAALSSMFLAPTLTVYYDFDEVDGVYANLGIGHAFEFRDSLEVSLDAGLGWSDADYNGAYFGVDESAFQELAITASLDYSVTDRFGVSVFVGYSELLDGDIEDVVSDPDIFSAGVGVTLSY